MSSLAFRNDSAADATTSSATVHRLPSSEEAYFQQRACAHRAMAVRSEPQVASVHHRFAAAYVAAAAAVERGESAYFDGEHAAPPSSGAH